MKRPNLADKYCPPVLFVVTIFPTGPMFPGRDAWPQAPSTHTADKSKKNCKRAMLPSTLAARRSKPSLGVWRAA